MALRLSQGTRQDMLGVKDFQTAFALSFINIYTGAQPSAANDAATGVLLATIYSNGTSIGISFDEPVAGAISKAVAETWSGTAVAAGTAGWFRLYDALDTPSGVSTLSSRVDGNIATSGADMNMSTTFIANGAVQTISTFTITLPASA